MRFDELREQLLKGGIAPRRVRRYLAELDDHLAELTAHELAAGHSPQEAAIRARALLGGDDELAQSWLADPRLRSFTARAPWVVFVVAPPFALLLAFLVPTLTLVIIAKTQGMVGQAHPAWFQHLAAFLSWTDNLALPALLSALLVWIARRQRLHDKWPLIGLAVIALLGMQLHASFPQPGHRGGSIMLGMLPFAGHGPTIYWQTLPAQWALMLAPALWIIIARRRLASSNPTGPHR